MPSEEDEMSNKTEATFHPATDAGPPGQAPEVDPLAAEHWATGNWPTGQLPIWADLTAQHGQPRHAPEPQYGAAGMHTWDPAPGERSWNRVGTVLGVVLVAALFLGLLGFVVQRMNWLPAGVPLIGKDSGVAACEAISKGQAPVKAKGVMTLDQYRQAREVFADSRYPAIRDNGTKLMDLAWQAQGMGSNNLGVLALVGPISDAYSGLAGGCDAAGYTIPSLGS
jgi:hypothetical protein